MSERSRRVLSDSASSYARFAIAMVVQFLLLPYMIRHLGADDYGLWTLTFSVLGFLSLVDFGFTTTVVRFTAEARGSGDLERRNRMLSTVLCLYMALAVLTGLLLWGVSPFYGDLLGIPPERREVALLLLWILGARSVAVSLPFGAFRSILFGAGRIGAVNLLQAGGTLLYGAAAVVALETGGGILGLAWGNLLAFALEHLAYLAAALRWTPGLRLSWRWFDRGLLRVAVGIGASQFVVTVATLVLLRTDPLIVNAFLPLAAVALYGVALKVSENALLLVKQGINVLGPHAAELSASGRTDGVRRLLVQGSRLTLVPAGVLAVGALVLGEEALAFWVGPDFREAWPPMAVLMVAVALMVPQMVASEVFTMTGHHRITALVSLAGMAVNVAASLLLVRPLGLLGVALGTLIATVLVDLVLVWALTARLHGVTVREWTVQVLLPNGAAGLAMGLGIWGLQRLWRPGTLWEVLAQGAVGGVCYLGCFLALHPGDRSLFRRRGAGASRDP